MDGQPVWLASISRRYQGKFVAVPRWTPNLLSEMTGQLMGVLNGVGDMSRQRMFRMNLTLCLHRAATDVEVGFMPDWFHKSKACGLAGGPVEVLWETVTGSQSTKPCKHPRKHQLDASDPLLWLPLDCGTCAPCLARAAIT